MIGHGYFISDKKKLFGLVHRHALVNLPQEKRVVFPSETLTAGAEVRSSAYGDLGAGVRAFRSANAPAPYVGVGR